MSDEKIGIADLFQAMDDVDSGDFSPRDAIPETEIPMEAGEVEPSQVEPEVKAIEKEVPNEPSEERIEYATFTDESGKKKKVKINLNDIESIKNTFSKAAGLVPKLQRERDQVKAELAKVAEPLQAYSKLEKAFEAEGIKGVISLLAGGEDKVNEFIESELDRRNWMATASHDEIKSLELSKELEQAKKERQELLDKVAKEREEAELSKQTAAEREMQAKLAGSFEKHRFSSDQYDAKTATKLNKVIWREALESLAELGNENPTRREIEAAFKEARSFVSGHVNKEVETKTKQVYENRKADAQRRVASHVSSSTASASIEDEVRDTVQKGGIRALMNKLWD